MSGKGKIMACIMSNNEVSWDRQSGYRPPRGCPCPPCQVSLRKPCRWPCGRSSHTPSSYLKADAVLSNSAVSNFILYFQFQANSPIPPSETMPAVPTAYYQEYLQGTRARSETPDYSTLQHLQWMADIVSNKVIRRQAQAPRSSYTEHHVYYHVVPMEPGAPANSLSRTPRSFFSPPNWSNTPSVESSPESRPTYLETQRVSRISVGARRGAVSYNPPPPAYNAEPARVESTQISQTQTQTQTVQAQIESGDLQAQHACTQAVCTQAYAGPERALTPKEFIQELQRLLSRGRGNQSPIVVHWL
ncbi:hypothetical protein RSAG8_08953, partial [Rhizoctonia solani AG-8 WAC10335]